MSIASIFTKFKSVKHARMPKETGVSSFCPYLCHWNSNTIITKSYDFVKVIKVTGFSFETADDEDLEIRKMTRNSMLKGIASKDYHIWVTTIRKPQSSFPEGEMPNLFSKITNDLWKERHEKIRASYRNEHYISIVKKADEGTSGALTKVLTKSKKASWEKDMLNKFDEMEETSQRVLNSLRNYHSEILGIVETPQGVFSELLEFLGQLVNGGMSQPMQLPSTNLDKYLPTHRLYFGKKSIEIKGSLGNKFAGVVSLKEYRPSTVSGMLDGFLQLPFSFILTQSFAFIERSTAISSMKIQQNRMIQSDDVAKSQIIEISHALDSAMSGEFAFGKHHATILCFADSLKELESNLSLAIIEFSNIGITAVREKVNMEASYWAQLPANKDYIVRASKINTLNFAGFASFHNYPSGKRKGNHWGNAVTVFNTVSGTQFFFSFHTRDVGHTTIIGPTGAGKTVLMNFLCCQAQKFDGRMFFFDKDRGAEIFIRAIDGKYSILNKANKSGFNPLQLEDNSDNRSFLVDWFRTLILSADQNYQLTPTDMHMIDRAVEGNYTLEKEERILTNLIPFFGLEEPGSIADRLSMWHGKGSHANLFDNKEDILDFTQAKNFGFEMGPILKDPPSLHTMLLYLFHRINLSLDGTPTAIILDEAWALIDNPVFAPKIKDWLKVLRKLNAFVVFATQSVEDAAKSDISDTLIQQTGTQIFLPNLKATQVYMTDFMLTKREFELIRTTDPSSRFFLVKQAQDSVIARIDLSGMSQVIDTLSGTSETILYVDKLIKEHGDDPNVWLPLYWEYLENK